MPLLTYTRKRLLPDLAILPAYSKSPVPLIRRFRPHDLSIGILGGGLFPKTQNTIRIGGYAMGVTTQLQFGRHLQLLAQVLRSRVEFQVAPFNLENAHIPILAPPTPENVLDHVDVRQPLWDFSLGLRYVFVPDQRLHPFLYTAWVEEQIQEQILRYEFENQLNKETTYVELPRNDSHFNAQGVQLGLGLAYKLSKRISCQLDGSYQRQYNVTVPQLKERWALTGAILYLF